jgi:diguanylate cyclase (GGDEF)-like protein
MSLRDRILLLVLLAALAPALVNGAFLVEHREQEVKKAKDGLRSLARYAAENLDDKVKGTVQLLHGLSRSSDLDTGKVACSAFLGNVLARYPHYTGLLTITPGGDLHCDSLRTGRQLNVGARGYFKQASATLEPAFEVVFGGLTGIAVLQVAYPVLDDRGALKLVLLASLNLSQYAQGFAAASHYPSLQALIWDRKGTLMVREPEDGEAKLAGKAFAASEVFRFAASMDAGATAELPDLDGVHRIWAGGAMPQTRGSGLRITLGVPRDVLLAKADADLRTALAVLIGISLLASLSAWLVAETGIRRPVRRISTAASRVGEGDLGARIGPPYPRGELGDLMAVVDRTSGLVQRTHRTLRVLSGINSLIVRVKDREELLQESCRIAVEVGKFRMAWVGMVNPGAATLEPVASCGGQPGYLASIKDRFFLAADVPEGATLTARAMREKKILFSNDLANDPAILHRSQHLENGVRSLVILPLLVLGKAVGMLALYSEEAGIFDDAELKLLQELAGDISFALEHIASLEKLEYLAYYDPLTGLASSALFNERLAQYLAAAGEAGRTAALFIIDLERFKIINDTFGRAAGDELLSQVAARLVGPGGEPARFARVGPDRFAVVALGLPTENDVLRLADQKLAQCFGPPFHVAGSELKVAVRFGIAVYPGDGTDAATLFRNAEVALKKAKAGGDRFLFYAPKMTERVAENLALESKLRQALERGEFVLHYQPRVDLETRAVVGVEALIRWRSPELGLVPAAKFIPLLEETGLILEVGVWALQRAARDHRGWGEQGLKAPRLSVNVSTIQLRQRNFVEVIEGAILDGVAPTGIDLEITETALMGDVEANIDKLKAVRGLGVRIAIDDFGTGYSSLAYLAKLPVQALKIDRSFIAAMLENSSTMALVSTMITLAHSLRLKVVAEGVETEEQATVLRLLRCDELQGHLVGKPVPLEEMTRMLGLAVVPARAA